VRDVPRSAIFALVFGGMLLASWVATRTQLHGETQALDARYFFLPAAQSLWEQGVPLQHDGKFCTHQPPFWPLVLAAPLAGARALDLPVSWVVRVLTALCAGTTALALAAMLRRWVPDARGAGAAAVVAMFLPPVAWLHREAYNEPLFMALLLWAVVLSPTLAVKPRASWAVAAGALFGAATLTRAIGLLVPAALLVALLAQPRDEWRARAWAWLLALTTMALVIAPWSWAATQATGRFTLVTTSFAHSHVDGLVHVPGTPLARRAAEQLESNRTREAVLAFHRAELARDPFAWVGLWLRKLPRSFFATESRRGEGVLLAMVVPLCVAGALSAFWLWRRRPETRVWVTALAALFGYFWAMSTAVWSTVRYITPVLWVPVVLVSAAALQAWSERRAPRATPAP
jgi:4-amino-4-deoxy-L-arabinose transferase-like glycosyltransferase